MNTNESAETKIKLCHKIRRLVDMKVKARAPDDIYNPYWLKPHSEEDRLKRLEEDLTEWAKEFEEFLRDHRSQDRISLSVERVYEETCSECGEPWNIAEEKGIFVCGYCGVPIEKGD